jgi:hypothetical protein
VSCIGSVTVTHLPSLEAITTNEGESPLKQTNVTQKPNVDSLEHRRFNLFSSELAISNNVLLSSNKMIRNQMDFTVVAPTKPMNISGGM